MFELLTDGALPPQPENDRYEFNWFEKTPWFIDGAMPFEKPLNAELLDCIQPLNWVFKLIGSINK